MIIKDIRSEHFFKDQDLNDEYYLDQVLMQQHLRNSEMPEHKKYLLRNVLWFVIVLFVYFVVI